METSLTPAVAADWLRLWRLVQQSSHSMASLLATFTDPATALSASPPQWRAAGIAPVRAQRLHAWQQRRDADLCREMDEGVAADLAWCEAPRQSLLLACDPGYPPLLREIADAPPLLFLKGEADALVLPQVAIVGTRQPTLTGREDAHGFAAELAGAGLAITSGMARGIDACAHAGALAAGGRTVAVLGTGPDLRYPRGNGRLYDAVLAGGGLIVSEFLPGTPPLPAHFPRRNRLISGLSLGVLVVEAAPESGSLITARLAAEQGRPVWALAGSRHNPQARGCLHLIREGASAVSSAGHILADLPPLLGFLRQQVAAPPAAAAPEPDAEAQRVLAALGCERRHPDWLVAATGLAPSAVLKALSRLEVAGRVAAVPGGYERTG